MEGINLRAIKIDLEEMASDIISKVDGGYYNHMSEKLGQKLESVLRKDKRFIVVEKNTQWPVRGYCGVHDKASNCFVFVNAERYYTGPWRETGRCCVYLKDGELMYKGISRQPYKERAFDICGQAGVYKEADKLYVIQSITFGGLSCLNSGFVKEALSFFPGIFMVSPKDHPEMSWRRLKLWVPNNMNVVADVCDGQAKYSIIPKNEWTKLVHPDSPEFGPMDEETSRAIEACAKADMWGLLKTMGDVGYDTYENILENHDGRVFQRTFNVVIEAGSPLYESKLHFLPLTEKEIDFNGDAEDLSDTCFVHTQDLTGTKISYVADALYEWNGMVQESIKEKDVFAVYDAIKKRMDSFSKKYGYTPSDALQVAAVLAKSPVIEKLFHLQCEGADMVISDIGNKIKNGRIEGDDNLVDYVGWLEKGKELHKILGIPKGAMEYAIEKKHFDCIGRIKSIFSGAEAKKYFQRMNKEDFIELFDFVTMPFNEGGRLKYMDLKKLVSIFGHENWKGYIRFLKNQKKEEEILYEEYLTMLIAVGDVAKGADWKLSGEALEKSMKSLRIIFDNCKTEELRMISDIQIAAQEPMFKEFAYESSNFLITYPKCADDIIKEGIALHHCAKEFCSKVGDGSSMLLFIRKRQKPDKPFYTMEIRAGQIRQCHGSNNRNMDKEPGLMAFLEEYCTEKGISFSTGEKLLGA